MIALLKYDSVAEYTNTLIQINQDIVLMILKWFLVILYQKILISKNFIGIAQDQRHVVKCCISEFWYCSSVADAIAV